MMTHLNSILNLITSKQLGEHLQLTMARTYRRNNQEHATFFAKNKKDRGAGKKKLVERDLEMQQQYKDFKIKTRSKSNQFDEDYSY